MWITHITRPKYEVPNWIRSLVYQYHCKWISIETIASKMTWTRSNFPEFKLICRHREQGRFLQKYTIASVNNILDLIICTRLINVEINAEYKIVILCIIIRIIIYLYIKIRITFSYFLINIYLTSANRKMKFLQTCYLSCYL